MGVDKVPIPRSSREIAAKAKKEKRYTTRKKFFWGGEKIREVWRCALPNPRKKRKRTSWSTPKLQLLFCVLSVRGGGEEPPSNQALLFPPLITWRGKEEE